MTFTDPDCTISVAELVSELRRPGRAFVMTTLGVFAEVVKADLIETLRSHQSEDGIDTYVAEVVRHHGSLFINDTDADQIEVVL